MLYSVCVIVIYTVTSQYPVKYIEIDYIYNESGRYVSGVYLVPQVYECSKYLGVMSIF